MKYEIKTMYEYDDLDEWSERGKEELAEDMERGWLEYHGIDGVTTNDGFPCDGAVIEISGKVVDNDKNYVEYCITRIVEVREEEIKKIEEWAKKCYSCEIKKLGE